MNDEQFPPTHWSLILDQDGRREECLEELARNYWQPVKRIFLKMDIADQDAEDLVVAHRRGIIHRDIKPANILMADGDTPILADFGIARLFAEDVTQTIYWQGTLSYMAPEQLKERKPDTRSDIYSLGATLYQMLTGNPPFHQVNFYELPQQIIAGNLEEPQFGRPQVPSDLNAICLKCMHTDPNNRYQSAQELVQDLSDFLAGRPVTARRLGLVNRTWKLMRRHKVVVIPVVLVVTTIMVGAVVSLILLVRTRQALERSHYFLGRVLLAKAGALQQQKKIFAARMLAARAIGFHGFGGPRSGYPMLLPFHSQEFHQARRLAMDSDEYRMCRQWQLPAAVQCCRLSRGGKWWAAGGKNFVAIGRRHSFAPPRYIACSGSVYALAFDDPTHRLVYGNGAGKIGLVDLPSGRLTATGAAHHECIYALAIHRSARLLATGDAGGKICLWRLPAAKHAQSAASLQLLRKITTPEAIYCLRFSPRGDHIAWGDRSGKIYRAAGNRPPELIGKQRGAVYDLAFDATGNLVFSCGQYGKVRTWPLAGSESKVIVEHIAPLYALVLAGSRLACAGGDGEIRIWDIAKAVSPERLANPQKTGELIARMAYRRPSISGLDFSGDANELLTSGGDGWVRLWNVSGGYRGKSLSAPTGIHCIRLSPTGKMLAVGCHAESGNSIRIWNLPAGKYLDLPKDSRWVHDLDFSGDGRLLAVAQHEQRVRVWDFAQKQWRFTINGHKKEVCAVRFSPDGKILASASADCTIRLWEVATGRQIKVFKDHLDEVHGLAFARQGNTLASCSYDRTIRIWDLEQERPPQVWRGHTARINAIAFSPDGNYLASGGDDRVVRLWDRRGRLVARLPGHPEPVYAIEFSKDGRWLASAGSGHTIKLWDVQTRQEYRTFHGKHGRIHGLAFYPGANYLLAGGTDAGVSFWRIAGAVDLASYLNWYGFADTELIAKENDRQLSTPPALESDRQSPSAVRSGTVDALWSKPRLNRKRLAKFCRNNRWQQYFVSYLVILAQAGHKYPAMVRNAASGDFINRVADNRWLYQSAKQQWYRPRAEGERWDWQNLFGTFLQATYWGGFRTRRNHYGICDIGASTGNSKLLWPHGKDLDQWTRQVEWAIAPLVNQVKHNQQLYRRLDQFAADYFARLNYAALAQSGIYANGYIAVEMTNSARQMAGVLPQLACQGEDRFVEALRRSMELIQSMETAGHDPWLAAQWQLKTSILFHAWWLVFQDDDHCR